jgi:serine/threonine protein kinase
MSDAESGLEPVEVLAEEFAARYRRGERPSLTEYTNKYPALAEQIQDLFPALVVMEELGSVASGASRSSAVTAATIAPAMPTQLGDYRIVREVGRGGMGVVYEAYQESLGRHVALKVFPSQNLFDPVHLERFRRESRAAAKLHHTNIVPVFGVGESSGVHYYVMQFIPGQGLDEVLKEVCRLRQPNLAEEGKEKSASVSIAQGLITGLSQTAVGLGTSKADDDTKSDASAPRSAVTELPALTAAPYFRSAARIGLQVAEALAYAHEQGILHRDIKPSNLLLDAHGSVWVTDFGLAKSEDAAGLTETGAILGTLRYMAPERFLGRSDPRSDVYGIGVTLYEMLTLQPAFSDSDRFRLIDRVTHEEPPRPRHIDRHIPRDLETIVVKAMGKDPIERYQTAAGLAEDLRRFLDDRSIQARRASPFERCRRWCRRHPGVAGLAAALLVVLCSSLAIVTYLWRDAEAHRNRADRKAEDESTARQFSCPSKNGSWKRLSCITGSLPEKRLGTSPDGAAWCVVIFSSADCSTSLI